MPVNGVEWKLVKVRIFGVMKAQARKISNYSPNLHIVKIQGPRAVNLVTVGDHLIFLQRLAWDHMGKQAH